MKIIRFTDRGSSYGCSEPGDMAGEYVQAEVAWDLLKACERAQAILCDPQFSSDEAIEAHNLLVEAIVKARGEVSP